MPGEYLRRLIADGCCRAIGADGFGLLAWIAAQSQPVELSRDELARRAGLSKRKAIDVVRAAIAAGWLSERPGIGRAASALSCVGLEPIVTTTTRVVSVGVSSGDALPVEPTPVVVPVESAEATPVSTSAGTAKCSSRSPVVATIPVELQTEAFAAAWQRWRTHRSEKRSTLTPSTEALQLKKLAAVGPDVALWAIEQSIANGWVGLFPERFTNQTQTKVHNANNRIGTGQRFKG